ncbi:MAG: alpha-ketoacid dehydrogenase subunit beta [Alphaproteobacteria bacterium]|nr:alpha-ketoacid dehydrogenase subunit beta [Alphaproteobacteria bacterium]
MSSRTDENPDGRRVLTYVDALIEGAAQEMDRDPSVFIIGLNVDDHRAIMGSTRGLVRRFGHERVMDTPLSEDAVTGICIGAAMAGLRPIHVHIRSDFLLLCMNQLVNMAAKIHFTSAGASRVPMVVRSVIGRSWGQGAQHSQGLHALFAHIPGLKVVAPATAHDAKGCLIGAIRDNNPVIFVEHRLLYPTESFVDEAPYTVPFGQARVCARGNDITLVGISHGVVECLKAAELLREVGILAEVVDPISLYPLDGETIVSSVARTGRVLVTDSAWTFCGMGAEIVAQVAESNRARGARAGRMGFAPTPCPTTPSLEKAFYPNPVTVAKTAYRMVRPDGPDWEPSPEFTRMAHQKSFKGPF